MAKVKFCDDDGEVIEEHRIKSNVHPTVYDINRMFEGIGLRQCLSCREWGDLYDMENVNGDFVCDSCSKE